MEQLVTDLTLLAQPSTPLKFLTTEGLDKIEATTVITHLKNYLTENPSCLAITAPQLGFNLRVFCIRFNDIIKTFINPIITKKSNYIIRPETFESMPGKEILIIRPEELTTVYYTDEFKYEENKLLGAAARIYDQCYQLLDGVLPSDLGLVSDVKEDGSLADLSEEEITEVSEFYKKFISTKNARLAKIIAENKDLEKEYRQLNFSEKVINGKASIVIKDKSKDMSGQIALANKKVTQQNNMVNRINMQKGNKKSKNKRRK